MGTPSHTPTRLGLGCLVALTLLGGCGGGEAGPDAPPRASVPIVSFTYRPATVTIGEGGSVTWTNRDGAPHTATSDDGRSFDTGKLRMGQSRTIRLGQAGSYRYHCTLHRFMVARVVVE